MKKEKMHKRRSMLEKIDFFSQNLQEEKKKLQEKPSIHPSSQIINCKIGAWTEIGPDSLLIETTFNDYSYADGDVSIIYSEIGKFCSIASHVRINPGNHPMERVTQHHCTYRRAQYGFDEVDDENFFQWRREHKCVIGNDVWLGHGAIIMPGVKIRTGAVVGAGAVVTKDVAAYEVVAGVPARPIRKRFPQEIIEKLLEIKWWDWERKTLEERFFELLDVNSFVKKY
jgi:phosphonate metabolism protein (transferase hexapeptide repeat family)